MMMKNKIDYTKNFNNPIMPGFYPDPSICRVDEDYYLVNSSFMYFPGVPIFHSRDLINWKQIGNVLDRESQISLKHGDHAKGIYAPTLRYHNHMFYMITTNVANGGNFIVTSDKPEGPWSDPYWLEADGIDPSLFFDDDGRCYYCGTKGRREGSAYDGDNEIYIQELDLTSMTLIGESYPIWHGALKHAIWAEGPHIYKKDEYYYLLISEGGTDFEHALTIARSKDLFADFEGCLMNPILTHRHLGRSFPIVNVGHGDFVETQNGEWWLVLLGSRPYGGYFRNLGRETFLVNLEWENGWPVINPGKGCVEEVGVLPNLKIEKDPSYTESNSLTYKFNITNLPYEFIYLRNPKFKNYSLLENDSCLRMYLTDKQLNSVESPSFIGKRQQFMSYTGESKLIFEPSGTDEAGLTVFQSNDYYYTIGVTSVNDEATIRIKRCMDGHEEIIHEAPCHTEGLEYFLKIEADLQALTFSYKMHEEEPYINLMDHVDGSILSTDVAGGFVGSVIAMYGVSGNYVKNYVDFEWFSILEHE